MGKLRRVKLFSSKNEDDIEDSVFTSYATKKVSREEAQRVMDEVILPLGEYDKRIQYGGEAQGFKSRIVTSDDPMGAFTYGEFPPSSMDELIDLALAKHFPKKSHVTMIDLGSGCGRLALYSALTRGFQENTPWTIYGIEIARILHDEALRATLSGIDNKWFGTEPSNDHNLNQVVLNLGPANEFPDLFKKADIIFAYSTTWDTAGFSEELGAIVMSPGWNQLLQQNCRPGTIVITTDRALDPNYGWHLVDRLDVENREVYGSTGYIHVLQEK